MNADPRSLLDRLLGAIIVLAVAAWLLRWAWRVFVSLWPAEVGLGVAVCLVLLGTYVWRNRYY